MFDLNLLWTLALAAGQALGITLCAAADVDLPQQLHQVVAIEMTSAPTVSIRFRPKTEEEKCRYTGVVVPYERLWEERTTALGIETVLPPEPGKIAAYAVIINRKDCEGRAPEAMFRVATHYRTMFNGDRLQAGATYIAMQLTSLPEATRPKWTQQVMDVLTTEAKTNAVAKEFLRFTEDSAKAAQAK